MEMTRKFPECRASMAGQQEKQSGNREGAKGQEEDKQPNGAVKK